MSDNEAITKFIDGLSDSLRNRLVLRRIENQSVTRQALVNLAVVLETGNHSTRASTAASSVALNAFQHKQHKSQQRCWFCKRTDHSADTCKKILARQAAGTWEDRSKKSKPQQVDFAGRSTLLQWHGVRPSVGNRGWCSSPGVCRRRGIRRLLRRSTT